MSIANVLKDCLKLCTQCEIYWTSRQDIGIENPNNLNSQVLDGSVCTVLRSLSEGANIFWEQVTCSSVVPGHKVTINSLNFPHR